MAFYEENEIGIEPKVLDFNEPNYKELSKIFFDPYDPYKEDHVVLMKVVPLDTALIYSKRSRRR